jgi:tetratricopeptide (TPR) repeat protein
MNKLSKFVGVLLFFGLFLVGCGIDIFGQQDPVEPTPIPPTETPSPEWVEEISMPTPADPNLLVTIPDLISEVDFHMEYERFPDAIAAIDQIIEILPDYAYAYVHRARIYFFWANNESDPQTARQYYNQALTDIYKAIELGPENGDYYFLAHTYERVFANHTEENYIDLLPHYEQAFEHLLLAIELGTTEEQANQEIGLELSLMYRCREAFDYLDRLISRQGMTASEDAGIDFTLSITHLCLGNLENAQEHMLAVVEKVPSQARYLYLAQIYYQAGDYEKALETVNNSYSTHGEFGGWRFYLRAAVQYELGDTEEALKDIERGEEETWIENHLRAYVLGRIALDKGSITEGLADLAAAQRTVNPAEFPKLLQDIDELFAAYDYEGDYVLPSQGLFENYHAYTDDEMELPNPPRGADDPWYVTYQGSGYILPFGEYYSENPHTYAFMHPKSVDLAEVSEISLILQGYFVETGNQEGELGLTFTLYNHASREWEEVNNFGFGRNSLMFAEDYVSEEGFVYLNIKPIDDQPAVLLSNVALEVTGTDSAGGPVYLGFGLGD